MAKLSYEERIKRLENRYNELVKPVFLIAESRGNNIDAVLILSNGKKVGQYFRSVAEFDAFVDQTENCNIIMDSQLLQFRTEELQTAIRNAETSDLKAIEQGTADPTIIKRVLFDGIKAQIK